MTAPSTAPQALRVIKKPIKAPKTMPFQLIAFDLCAPIPPQSPTSNVSSRERLHMEQYSQSAPLFETRILSLRKIHQGKVRDIYDVDDQHLLIVATDRLSAFDVVLPDPIPFK